MKNPGFILLWLGSAAALALAYLKLMHQQWLSAVLLLIIGASVIFMSIWVLRSLNRLEVPIEPDRFAASAAIQDGPIIMQWSKQNENVGQTLFWPIGFLGTAIGLVLVPEALWRWWLSYPAALVFLALTLMMMMTAMNRKLDRIIADANGIEIQNKAIDTSFLENRSDLSPEQREASMEMLHDTKEKVAWREVGAVKMVDTYVKTPPDQGISNLEFKRRELVLFGHDGIELMRLEAPLDPPQAYQRFLDSIPRWTKLTIQEVRENR